MTKKKRKELTFVEKMQKITGSGISGSPVPNRVGLNVNSLGSIEERVQNLIGIVKQFKSTSMLFFVMYDIESNKVRNQVFKYLQKMGCFRVQRSIFIADLSREKYEQIRSDLVEVQGCYENEDSILIVPVSTELLRSMKIIGKSIDVDLIMKTKNTLFFWKKVFIFVFLYKGEFYVFEIKSKILRNEFIELF